MTVMRWSAIRPALSAAAAVLLSLAFEAVRPGTAAAVEVELELVLAVDTSASVDNWEFRLQMGGLASAFRHPEVIAAIEAHGERGIAVTLVQWSSGSEQAQTVPWHHVHDAASAARFAGAVERTARVFAVSTTAIGSVLRYCARLFPLNRFRGRRMTIDVSGDGRSNAGLVPTTERDRAVAAGVTINGLAILNGDPGLERYFRLNVIGGPAAFVETATDFPDFARAIREKLLREIAPFVSMRPQRPPTNRETYSALGQLSWKAPFR